MKRLTVAQWAQVLVDLTKDASSEAEVAKQLQAFVRALKSRRATKMLPRILVRYQALRDAEQGIIHFKTVAARELPQSVIASLQELGKKVIIDHTIDPQVVGGLKLQVGDVIIDGTIARALRKLYEN